MPVAFRAAIKVVLDKKCGAELFVKLFDGRVAEIDVRIDDVGVVGFEPRGISGPDRATFARNYKAKTSAP